jgi:hypothetical protein
VARVPMDPRTAGVSKPDRALATLALLAAGLADMRASPLSACAADGDRLAAELCVLLA